MTDKTINIKDIEKNNDRESGGFGNLQTLARDMEENGQINPISVIETEAGSEALYRIITGRRRLAAAELLGWEKIRATVYASEELNGNKEIAIALSENVNREEMDAIDEGKLYAFLMEQEGKTAQELAYRFNRATSAIYQRAKLSKLSLDWQLKIKEEGIAQEMAAKIACLTPEVQQKVFEKCDKNESWGGWYINSYIAEETNTIIGQYFWCDKCEVCEKRTHFENNLLFPELNNRDNYCLDSDCFQKVWKKQLETQFDEWITENEEVSDNIAVFAEENAVPESVKTTAIDGKALQIGDNIYSWYTDKDVMILREWEVKQIQDEFFIEKIFPVVVMEAGSTKDASYTFAVIKVMLKQDYDAWKANQQKAEPAEKTRTDEFLETLDKEYQDKLKEAKKMYRTWDIKNRAANILNNTLLEKAVNENGMVKLEKDEALSALNVSDSEIKELSKMENLVSTDAWIKTLLVKRMLNRTGSIESIINAQGLIPPELKAIYTKNLEIALSEKELLELAKEAYKQAILEQ